MTRRALVLLLLVPLSSPVPHRRTGFSSTLWDAPVDDHEPLPPPKPADTGLLVGEEKEGRVGDSFSIQFENGTAAPSLFQVIPVDYLCDFCEAVIAKLQARQQSEANFEKNVRDSCTSYNKTELDDANICQLINKVAFDRLRDLSANKICAQERFCEDQEAIEKAKADEEERKKQEEEQKKYEEKLEQWRLQKEEQLARIREAEERERNRQEAVKLAKEAQNAKEEKQKQLRQQIHSPTGDVEYIVDEVHNPPHVPDYLDENDKGEHVVTPKPVDGETDKDKKEKVEKKVLTPESHEQVSGEASAEEEEDEERKHTTAKPKPAPKRKEEDSMEEEEEEEEEEKEEKTTVKPTKAATKATTKAGTQPTTKPTTAKPHVVDDTDTSGKAHIEETPLDSLPASVAHVPSLHASKPNLEELKKLTTAPTSTTTAKSTTTTTTTKKPPNTTKTAKATTPAEEEEEEQEEEKVVKQEEKPLDKPLVADITVVASHSTTTKAPPSHAPPTTKAPPSKTPPTDDYEDSYDEAEAWTPTHNREGHITDVTKHVKEEVGGTALITPPLDKDLAEESKEGPGKLTRPIAISSGLPSVLDRTVQVSMRVDDIVRKQRRRARKQRVGRARASWRSRRGRPNVVNHDAKL